MQMQQKMTGSNEGLTVREYRFYYLDARGHIERGVDLTFSTDAEAIRYAENLSTVHGAELWNGDRKVRDFTTVS